MRIVTGLAAAGVLGGALAGGGVALASTSSASSATASHATTTAAAAVATPTATAPASGRCDGRGAMGGLGPAGGMWAGQSAMNAAASYLGISQDQLRSQLQAGKSLAELATAKGKSVSGLKNAIIAAATSRINATAGLSAAQKAELISEMKSHVNSLVNATLPSGLGMRGMGGPAGGPAPMMGGM